MEPQVTRIAPSPTGDLHLGTARTAYLNYLAAKASKGKFILRIDDTDVERNKPEYVDTILRAMLWLGLNHDEMHYQSQRTHHYSAIGEALANARLAVRLAGGAIALKWFDFMPRFWTDSIAGEISITDTNIGQIDERTILLTGEAKGNRPTYQFASVVDDIQMGVNHVIRGTDHITNTCKQVAIWTAISKLFGQSIPLPAFSHVGLIFKDKKKMSKRDGAASLLAYQQSGIHPEALLNFMLRLGWGGRDITDGVIPVSDAIKLFFQGKMRNVNCSFDNKKLEYFNREYTKIREKNNKN